MIEACNIINCISQEQYNIEQLNKLKHLTYLSSPAIIEEKVNNKLVNENIRNGMYSNSSSSYLEKQNKYNSIIYSQNNRINTYTENNNTNMNTSSNKYLSNEVLNLKGGVKYKVLDKSVLYCKFGMECRDRISGKCKFHHSFSKPSMNKICRRGPTCEFLKQGKCAFIH